MPQWKSLITVPGISSFHTFVGLLALFVMVGCGGSPPSAPVPPPPAPVPPPLDLSKHRNLATDRVEPVLSDRQTADNSSVPANFD